MYKTYSYACDRSVDVIRAFAIIRGVKILFIILFFSTKRFISIAAMLLLFHNHFVNINYFYLMKYNSQ